MRQFLSVLIFLFTPWFASAEQISDSYQAVDLKQFYSQNQIPHDMAAEKKRVMFQPVPVSFVAELVSKPKPGKFSLAYDALQFWGEAGELPVIDHSAFVGFPAEGLVLGMYLTQEAAKMLQQAELESSMTFYAMHIYNYAKGPRLVVVAAKPN